MTADDGDGTVQPPDSLAPEFTSGQKDNDARESLETLPDVMTDGNPRKKESSNHPTMTADDGDGTVQPPDSIAPELTSGQKENAARESLKTLPDVMTDGNPRKKESSNDPTTNSTPEEASQASVSEGESLNGKYSNDDSDPWSADIKNSHEEQQQSTEHVTTNAKQTVTESSANKPTGKGAQILMNRFSSWREKANTTSNVLSNNAQEIFSARTKFFSPPRTSRESGVEEESIGGSSSESSFEEDGTITTDDESGQLRAVTATSGAAESVSASFRGRYSTGSETEHDRTPTSKREKMKQSQTALIMQSSAAKHMQSILESLEPNEYVMLLGNGMLGVNLKQTYLKNHGVYMDYFVKGGSAETSGVVHVGDVIVKVGETDVKRGTILDVPQTIAAAKRPCVLLFSTNQVSLAQVNYIDIAVAMMHKIQEDAGKRRDIASMPLHDDEPIEERKLVSSKDDEKDLECADETPQPDNEGAVDQNVEPIVTPDFSILAHSFVGPNCLNPLLPPPQVKDFLSNHISKRFDDESYCTATMDENFRAALQNAFIACTLDGRRLPFLASYFSLHDEIYDSTSSSEDNDEPAQTVASKQLMLFLELISFVDLYGATPASRRRATAMRIAGKFFLPSLTGDKLTPPMFDFHHIVPDSELRALERALNNKDLQLRQDMFAPFRDAVIDLLSGSTFISFLVSDECSRMRAYLRCTAPYINLSIKKAFDALTCGKYPADQTELADVRNHFSFIMIHLLCQTENELGTENDLVIDGAKNRVTGAPAGMSCAIYIKRDVIAAMEDARNAFEKAGDHTSPFNEKVARALIEAFVHLWDVFVAPDAGALDSLSHSNETSAALDALRVLLHKEVISRKATGDKNIMRWKLVESLIKSEVSDALGRLSEELLYEYAVNAFPKYREHKFHEWMCTEASKHSSLSSDGGGRHSSSQDARPALPNGCIKRIFRKLELPVGVSSHRPERSMIAVEGSDSSGTENPNADFAVVFGTDEGLGLNRIVNPLMEDQNIRRYTCQPITLHDGAMETKCFVPPTLESYATIAPFRSRPFSKVVDASRFSSDGWEISLTNFMMPNADASSESGQGGSIFGVSLVLQADASVVHNTEINGQETLIELVHSKAPISDEPSVGKHDDRTDGMRPFASPLSFSPTLKESITSDAAVRQVHVSSATPNFNRRLGERSWSKRVTENNSFNGGNGRITVGIALVSNKNSILAMRDTLSRFLFDHARTRDDENDSTRQEHDVPATKLMCGPLVNLLGNFSHEGVEGGALKCLLEPYLRFGSSPWIEQPLRSQAAEFEFSACQQLIESLPPIPLALLFVATLLEQKIVFSSSRRSLLFSATVALTQLLKPLTWSHLLVPLVPSTLATDLVQYPAPFVLGIPSEDPGSMELLNSLPEDVTLVDLDVGRVILARSLAHNNGMIKGGGDEEATARALRSQVLYLAQSLGVLFGSRLQEEVWCSDSPSVSYSNNRSQFAQSVSEPLNVKNLRHACRDFIMEILKGTSSCCYWIEEHHDDKNPHSCASIECNVLFDEDRFYHIKNVRADGRYQPLVTDLDSIFPSTARDDKNALNGTARTDAKLALSLEDFDLILESFLRCQSLSTFISACPKKKMAFY